MEDKSVAVAIWSPYVHNVLKKDLDSMHGKFFSRRWLTLNGRRTRTWTAAWGRWWTSPATLEGAG